MTVKDRNWIRQHTPQQGEMCLLDAVAAWDGDHIVCLATGHRMHTHPLRHHGRLGAVCGIEYAAQAVALHEALCAGTEHRSQQGYLAGVRSLQMHVTRLDDIPGPLEVRARRLSVDRRAALYEFSLHARERALVTGRVAVVLDPAGFAAALRAQPT